jgi:hypothetical protein
MPVINLPTKKSTNQAEMNEKSLFVKFVGKFFLGEIIMEE